MLLVYRPTWPWHQIHISGRSWLTWGQLLPHLADVGAALLDGHLAGPNGVVGGRIAAALEVGAVPGDRATASR